MPAIFHDVFNRKTIRRGIFFVAIYSYHFVDKIFEKISLEARLVEIACSVASHYYLYSLLLSHMSGQLRGLRRPGESYHLSSLSDLTPLSWL